MKPNEVPDDPLSRFSLALFRLNGLIARVGERATSPVGQTSARWQVLGRTGIKPRTVAHMARDMGHARQSVQRVTDALAEEGLVAYIDNPDDQRARLVELTPKGADVLMAIYEQYGAWSQHIMTKIDAAHLANVADSLEQLADIFEADEIQNGNDK